MTQAPRVAAIVVNWNGQDDTIRAVKSLQTQHYSPLQTIVVDNGSRPESRRAIRNACPDVEILETGSNLGYAGGNNAGLRLALERGADYCLVLNNDAVVEPDTLDRLVRAMESDPALAVAGPRVYRMDRPEELFYPGWRIDWRRHLFHRAALPPSAEPVRDVDYVQGCALLIRASFLRAKGLFDERYHLYCEDADLCVRARRAGLRTVEVAAARALHRGYGSTRAASPLKAYYGLRNRLLFISLHAPPRNRASLRFHLLFFDAGDQALAALARIARGDVRSGWTILRALTRATLDALTGRYGPGPDWLFSDQVRR